MASFSCDIWLWKINSRSSRLQKFFKIGVLKSFAILTRKRLCWSLFNKVEELAPGIELDEEIREYAYKITSQYFCNGLGILLFHVFESSH